MAKITAYSIIIDSEAPFSVRNAAAFLQQEIRLICGKTVPILPDTEPIRAYEIVLGKTSREELDGISFERSRQRRFEYELLTVGDRLYMTGLGIPPEDIPYTSSYRMWDDGQCGTSWAVYRFTEDVLGHAFLDAAYVPYVEKPDLEMPVPLNLSYKPEVLLKQLPKQLDGTAMYLFPASSKLDFAMTCIVFKTRTGKLIVVDGGHDDHRDAEHVIRCLESISGGEKPVVAAWLFSHLHADHYGVYAQIYEDPALAKRISVQHVYAYLLSEEQYKAIPGVCEQELSVRQMILNCSSLGAQYHQVKRNQQICVDDLMLEVLRIPEPESVQPGQMNLNDTSVVYKVHVDGKQTILLPGDGEWITDRDLKKLPDEVLKSDVVQVAHHGVGNLSKELYGRIGARHYLWQAANRFYYSDEGEGLNSKNLGVLRTRMYLHSVDTKPHFHYRDTNGILSLKLPLEEL